MFMGNPYITTPESIKANSDKLFVSGVNQIVYHGFPNKFDDGSVKGIGYGMLERVFDSLVGPQQDILGS